MKRSQKIIYTIIGILAVILMFFLSNGQFDIPTNNLNNKLDVGELANNFVIAEESELQIIYFNVGNADCILLKDDSDIMLIDAGNEQDGKYIIEYLKQLGINEINYLIGTHEHEDHIGGMNYIVDNFEIENIFLTKTENPKENPEYNELLNSIQDNNYKHKIPDMNKLFILGDSTFTVKHVSNAESNPNNNSIVIELENNGLNYLFTGDIESKIEKDITWNEVDVLKVSHHGSDTSTSEKFLSLVFPKENELKEKVSVISTGNRSNLLDEIILQRLKAIPNNKIYITRDASVYITNINGENYVETLKTKVDSIQH